MSGKATSYCALRRSGRRWAIALVTPGPDREYATTLATFTDRGEAVGFGQDTASSMGRAFKLEEVRRG
jgi:hypothetical protein